MLVKPSPTFNCYDKSGAYCALLVSASLKPVAEVGYWTLPLKLVLSCAVRLGATDAFDWSNVNETVIMVADSFV